MKLVFPSFHYLLLTLLFISGVAMQPAFALVDNSAKDPESMTEWMVEGRIKIKLDDEKDDAWFSWTQLGTEYKLELRKDSIVGPIISTTEGELGSTDLATDLQSGQQGAHIITSFKKHQLYDSLVFWLRGLVASEAANIEKEEEGLIEEMNENGWELEFDDYLAFNEYSLPREIELKSNAGKVDIEIYRAETGFLSHWCSDYHPGQENNALTEEQKRKGYIDTQAFCKQLAELHGGNINPKHGIFGPDSMMWKINKYIAPPGLGAGRALLLQISHPWVTAGIDDHSDVRNDPFERARRTYMYMYTLVYGSLPQAMNAANEVHQIHQQIRGKMRYQAGRYEEASEYRANHIEAMIWVNATLWDTLVKMYEQVEHKLSDAEKERFYQETKLFSMMFGIPPEAMPEDWTAFQDYMKEMMESDALAVTADSDNLADMLFGYHNIFVLPLMPIQKYFTAHNLHPRFQKAYDLETNWFGRMMYKPMLWSAKIADRLLIPPIRKNAMYQEAMARIEGKKTGFFARKFLKWGIHKPTLVN